MKTPITFVATVVLLSSCVTTASHAQTVEWIRQFGTVGPDKGQSVSTDALGNVYITGYVGGDIDGAGSETHAGADDAFVSKYDSSGVLAWTRQLGTSRSDGGRDVTTDASGNVYITGLTRGDLDGAGAGTNAGGLDAFISKYDSSGTLAWTRQLGTSDFDYSYSLSADAFGNIYISGETGGDLDGAGAGTHAGRADAFISKYDSSGTLAWTKQFGTSDIDVSTGVATDAFGNVYISGYTRGDLDGAGAGTSAGNYDAFVSKYDSSGTLVWIKQLGTSSSDVSTGVATDAYGNVYITGYTDGDIDGAGAGTHAGLSDAFVSKYTSSGVLAWTRQLGSSRSDSSAGVSTDAYGNVYISGRTRDDLDGAGPGTHASNFDAFVSKYDRSGTLVWTWQLGTIRDDESYGVSADAFGNVYVSGWTEGDIDGAGAESSDGREDVFLIKLQVGPEPQVVELVPRGSLWSYLDNGTDQGTAWRDREFDDSAWQSSPAELGYGDGQATEVSFGGDAGNKHATTYFRHWFEVDDTSRVLELTLDLLRDDGAAVYLNGVEVRRDNLNPNTSYDDFATDVVGGADESTFFLSATGPILLRDGMNLLAVEVHQANRTSSDISFDLQLTALINPIPEPGTLSMLAIGLGAMLCRCRRRARWANVGGGLIASNRRAVYPNVPGNSLT